MLLKKIGKFTLLVLLGAALSTQAVACPPAKDGTVKPSHVTSINIHQPGTLKDDVASLVNILLPVGSGYRVEAKGTGSGKFAPALIKSIEEGKLSPNVVFTYGRTGETPPGRNIYMHLYNAKDKNLLGVLPARFTLKPEFQKIADDIDQSGRINVPYVGVVTIFYNPALIKKEDVPKSWQDLASFNGAIAVPGSGCFSMRTLTALYHTVGEEAFVEIIKKAKMPAMETIKNDPRKSEEKPKGGTRTSIVVAEGEYPIGIGPLTSTRTQELIASGAINVIWPEEGAIVLPHLLAVRTDPNEADLTLAGFIANNLEIRRVLLNAGVSSTLRGGKVLPVIRENGFKFVDIPIKKIMQKDVHKRIIEIVERYKPKT